MLVDTHKCTREAAWRLPRPTNRSKSDPPSIAVLYRLRSPAMADGGHATASKDYRRKSVRAVIGKRATKPARDAGSLAVWVESDDNFPCAGTRNECWPGLLADR